MDNLTPRSATAYKLAEASRLIREAFRQRANHLNLSQPQWRTLMVLSRCPGINQVTLAEKLELNPVTVAQSIDRLVKADWVRRERQTQDRRAVSLYLTEQAGPILEELNQIAAETSTIALASLTQEQCNALELMLMQIKQNLITLPAPQKQ